MSSATWTRDALSSEVRPGKGAAWRLVEAQHRIATLKLVDDLDEQAILERLIEATKDSVPEECRHLDSLLSTPFRHTPYPHGSRFRRAGLTPGVFYGAETTATALAETAFWRLVFFAESPGTPWPANPLGMTAFRARYAHPRMLDLFGAAFEAIRPALTQPTDYEAPHRFAEDARAIGTGVIRYPSVCDPRRGANLAILACTAFTDRAPTARQTWRLHLNARGVHCLCETTRERRTFGREAFGQDPRIGSMVWER
jgi:hypothetical protein